MRAISHSGQFSPKPPLSSFGRLALYTSVAWTSVFPARIGLLDLFLRLLGGRARFETSTSNQANSEVDLPWLMSAQALLADIHALEEDLLAFERKYGVRSEIFFAAYAHGEEPENDAWVLDFTEWASVYRTWLARQAEYRDEISRLQARRPSLLGLVRVLA
jgi:hypothetical protein